MRGAPALVASALVAGGVAWGLVAYAARGTQLVEGHPFRDRVAEPPAGILREGLFSAGDVTTVLAHPTQADILYTGARGGLFASENGGRRWRRVLSLRGADVHDIAVAPSRSSVLYVGTSRGLLRSDDGGLHWRLRYSGRGGAEAEVLAVAVHPTGPDTVAIGTPRRCLVSRDGGITWQPGAEGVEEAPVRALLYHPVEPAFLYMVTSAGLYRSTDGGTHWARLLVQTPAGNDGEAPDADPSVSEGPPPVLLDVGSVALDPAHPQRLFVGTTRGVWRSDDAGETWRPLPSVGMGHPAIRHLMAVPGDPDHLYAATSAGLFLFSHQWRAWRPITEGLPTHDIRRLAWSPDRQTLWAATTLGVMPVPLPHPPVSPPVATPLAPLARQGLETFAGEPAIAEVQAAAIRYAEVMPEKIQTWRTRAAWRAWIPSFTLGLDRDVDTTIGSSSSGGKTTFTVGPEDRSLSLDFGFTWDLADLVWNPDQTSIDVRSRLMVQLRGDVLDEVTRLYFERRRLQVEYALVPVEDPTLQAGRRLRVDELTAQIDALTGGFFSRHLAQPTASTRPGEARGASGSS